MYHVVVKVVLGVVVALHPLQHEAVERAAVAMCRRCITVVGVVVEVAGRTLERLAQRGEGQHARHRLARRQALVGAKRVPIHRFEIGTLLVARLR